MPARTCATRVSVLQELFGSEPAFQAAGPDRGSFLLDEIQVEASFDARGWLGVVAKLPAPEVPEPALAASLLEAHGRFRHPAKFSQAEAGLSVDLRVDIPKIHPSHLGVLRGAATGWLCEGVELFRQVCKGNGREEHALVRSAPNLPPVSGSATFTDASQRMEQALKESCLEWSPEEVPGSCAINLDLEEYFQKVRVTTYDGQSLLFQSSLVGPSPASGDVLKALAHFLMRANHNVRFVRLSLETEPASSEEGPGSSRKSVVAELAWPLAQLPALSIEKAVAALIVAARLTRLEAEVLFDPGAAQAYLGCQERR